MITKEARLELIVGTMFAGKSTELIRRATSYQGEGLQVQLFKPSIDNRYAENYIASHDGLKMPAYNVASVAEMMTQTHPYAEVIGIEETQFFESGIIEACQQYVSQGKIVIAAGLLKDFRDEAFAFKDGTKTMMDLFLTTDHVTILTAICKAQNERGEECKGAASHVQRFIDGQVAPYDSPVVQVGGKEDYAPRCRQHYQFYKI